MFGLSQMDVMKNMMSMVSPKSAFGLMAKHISTELKIDVTKFDINFNVKDKKIFITAYSDKLEGGKITKPFDKGEKYADLATHYLKEYMPKDTKDTFELDIVLVNYDEKSECLAYMFGVVNGEKKSFEHKF